MKWTSVSLIIYICSLVAVSGQIIFETQSTNKTLAYLLFCLFIPFFGILFYLPFGINRWRKRRYDKKIKSDTDILTRVRNEVSHYDEVQQNVKTRSIRQNAELTSMLIRDLGSPLTTHNKVKLLINGEVKFPELINALKSATHHIHLEYYIYEYDDIGSAIIELLIQKAKEGIKVKLSTMILAALQSREEPKSVCGRPGLKFILFIKYIFISLPTR